MPLFYEAYMKRLEVTDFTDHIGTTFTLEYLLEGAPASSDLILVNAEPFKLDPKDRRITDTTGNFRSVPFSLFFESNEEKYLPQSLYTVKHPGFPEGLEIFIVCIGPADSGSGYQYEAAFG